MMPTTDRTGSTDLDHLDDLLPNDLPRPKLPPTLRERIAHLRAARAARAFDDPGGGSRLSRASFEQQPILMTVLAAVIAGGTVVAIALGWSAWQDRSSIPAEDLLPILGAAETVATDPLDVDTVAAGSAVTSSSAAGGTAVAPAASSTPGASAPAPGVDAATMATESVGHAADDLPTEIAIHVAGAVVRPGVVYLSPDARVVDAIQAVGGGIDRADIDRLNLASPLVDGQQVYVPSVGEEVSALWPGRPVDPEADASLPSPEPAPTTVPLIDINQASELKLQELPGIGPTMAAAIVGYRESVGGYVSVDELVNVSGIGPTRLETLRPLVVAGAVAS